MALTWNTLTGSTNTAGALARWLNKSTLSSGAGGDADLILQEATSWIYARLRHWKMLSAPVSGTMTAGQDTVVVPSDLLTPDFFKFSGLVNGSVYVNEIPEIDINDIYRRWQYDSTGARVQQQPVAYGLNGTNIQFDSPPDLAYPYIYTYFQQPAALSGNNSTNFLTTFYPRLLRAVCMMMGAEWVKESNQGQFDRTYWAQQAQAELDAAQAQSDMARKTRGGMVEDMPMGGWYF